MPIFVPATSTSSWRDLQPKHHWKHGYSAESLADYWQGEDGFPVDVRQIFESVDVTSVRDPETRIRVPHIALTLIILVLLLVSCSTEPEPETRQDRMDKLPAPLRSTVREQLLYIDYGESCQYLQEAYLWGWSKTQDYEPSQNIFIMGQINMNAAEDRMQELGCN